MQRIIAGSAEHKRLYAPHLKRQNQAEQDEAKQVLIQYVDELCSFIERHRVRILLLQILVLLGEGDS